MNQQTLAENDIYIHKELQALTHPDRIMTPFLRALCSELMNFDRVIDKRLGLEDGVKVRALDLDTLCNSRQIFEFERAQIRCMLASTAVTCKNARALCETDAGAEEWQAFYAHHFLEPFAREMRGGNSDASPRSAALENPSRETSNTLSLTEVGNCRSAKFEEKYFE